MMRKYSSLPPVGSVTALLPRSFIHQSWHHSQTPPTMSTAPTGETQPRCPPVVTGAVASTPQWSGKYDEE